MYEIHAMMWNGQDTIVHTIEGLTEKPNVWHDDYAKADYYRVTCEDDEYLFVGKSLLSLFVRKVQ